MGSIRIKTQPGAHLAVGLMSGTSHDGIGAALVRLRPRRTPCAQLVAFHTYPYQAKFRARLLAATAGDGVGAGAGEISTLNFYLGRALSQAVVNLCRRADVAPAALSFIGSHGHTFFHLPPGRTRRGAISSTMQLGESAIIAALTGVPVVSDFRPMDIAVGGEGAPLAPLAHLRLFGHRRRGRAVQNIGGIGNVTYLPPGAAVDDPRLIAFDTGPGNLLIDALADRFSRGRWRMDRNGRMAAQGEVNEALLARLMRHRYFSRRPPKSTGREEFGGAFFERALAEANQLKVRGADLFATFTALTARAIALALTRFVRPLGPLDELVLTGGGARNPVLCRMIAAAVPGVAVKSAEALGVDGDALEAVAFALLAWETLRGRPGNIPSATGARQPAVLGKITLPPGQA